MSTELLEQKLLDLTRRVEKLEARPVAKQTWREAIGSSKGDAMSTRVFRL